MSRDDDQFDAVEGQPFARLDGPAAVAGDGEVLIPDRPSWALLHGLAVIDEGANLHTLRKCRQPAGVVAVKVRDEHVVEALQARDFANNPRDPPRVTVVEALESGVHQHRLPAGGDDQRRRAALDVDPVDIERAGRVDRVEAAGQNCCDHDRHSEPERPSGWIRVMSPPVTSLCETVSVADCSRPLRAASAFGEARLSSKVARSG